MFHIKPLPPHNGHFPLSPKVALVGRYIIRLYYNGLLEKKIHTPPTDGILDILAGGGSKTGNAGGSGGMGGGVNLKKSSARGHFDR